MVIYGGDKVIIHNSFSQQSAEWAIARSGRVTASGLDNLLTPKFKQRDGKMVDTYLHTLLAERWIRGPLPSSARSFAMDQGVFSEADARPAFTVETGLEVTEVGLIETDDGSLAASPDGLIADTSGVELKCPTQHVHIGYCLGGELPEQYAPQVYGCMAVSGFSHWYFCSFRRNMAPFILKVERDETIIATIKQAVSEFNERFEAAWKKLCELNGGPPPEPKVFVPSSDEKPKFSWEQTSEMPS